ncbi:hypothetical protein HPB51_001362 [Rhipicephalus microplus]|uniref:Cathepsin propeptide inhibitor domain-containing protein n=1 Tax=Rhipicephalus microplus TaxID=6941 RepID=A0A9J6EQT2_RHIMP|nr:hypothetical protein HPB51_001362 [Rhipicephalus microplus]
MSRNEISAGPCRPPGCTGHFDGARPIGGFTATMRRTPLALLPTVLQLSFVAAASITAPTDDSGPPIVASSVEDAFAQYVARYNKSYEPGSEEHERRFAAFRDSLERIARRNATGDTARYGLTRFSDFTPDEFRRNVLSSPPADLDEIVRQLFPDLRPLGDDNDIGPLLLQPVDPKKVPPVRGRYPDHFDWRDRSAVTPVKNQQNCGACWAISTVENVESMYAIATGKLVRVQRPADG